MKKFTTYLFCLLCLAGIMLLVSCNGVTNVSPKGEQLESNYYMTPDQVFKALVAAYNPVGWQTYGGKYNPLIGGLNSAADECFAGGGGPTDVRQWHAWNSYKNLSAAVGPQEGYWQRSYTGINRANLLLQKIDGVKGLSADKKSRYIAEAKFLRGYYYFWLIRLFKNVPLITKPLNTAEIYQQKQAVPDSVYAQIENDFKAAIPDLPSAPLPADEEGRATKGAARAFLAKTLIWEVGSGNNKSKLKEAANLLEKVNTNPAYHLLKSYPDIFSPANKFNAESIFEITHTSKQQSDFGLFGSGNLHGNIYVQMVGPRSYSGPIYHSGYSFNPITPAYVDSMRGDPRYQYTIANIDSLTKATGGSYVAGYHNTGYFVKKYAPRAKYAATVGAVPTNWPNDYIEVRLAGTYLLEAEAIVRAGGDQSKAAHYLNAVRARVGLSSESPTLANIYHEMYMELGTEGHRWFHLVRTGRAGKVLGRLGYDPSKNNVLPIPLESLNNTKLNQNPHYN
jgi:hypothetical protein